MIGARTGLIRAVGAALLVALLNLVLQSPSHVVFDERYYLEAAHVLRAGASFSELMRIELDVAAGPLYGYLHYLAAPLTGLQPPAIRLVNVVLIAAILLVNAALLKRSGEAEPGAASLMLLSLPLIWPTIGMALTELPAMLFASLATLLAMLGAERRCTQPRRWAFLIAAGLCAGLAVEGRQTYLPALLGFAMLALFWRDCRGPAIAGLLAALAMVAPMALAWHGLSPPWEQQVSGLSPEHGVLAFTYLAVSVLFIAPDFVISQARRLGLRRAAAVTIGTGLAALGVVALGFRFNVGGQVLAHLPPALQALAALGLNAAMLTATGLVMLAGLYHAWQHRGQRQFVILSLLTVLTCGTAAGIGHQFSSRYVLSAFPFALLVLAPWIRPNLFAAARLALGGVLGLVSLAGYYANPADAVTPFHPEKRIEQLRSLNNGS